MSRTVCFTERIISYLLKLKKLNVVVATFHMEKALVEIEKLREGSFPALTRGVHGLAFLVATGAEVAHKKCEEFFAVRTVLITWETRIIGMRQIQP